MTVVKATSVAAAKDILRGLSRAEALAAIPWFPAKWHSDLLEWLDSARR